MSSKSLIDLVREASVLSEIVNTTRFQGIVPDADVTVRLCETLSVIEEMVEEQNRQKVEDSWSGSVDRQGGSFSAEELDRLNHW